MVKKTKGKKFRGSGSHGRGQKGGRGAGLRGGRGRAGLHKHKYATTVILEAQGVRVFGRHGFKRPQGASRVERVLNVNDLAERFPGQKKIDLRPLGYTKLLGGGSIAGVVEVTVARASERAVEKVKAAGGTVVLTAAVAKVKGDA